VCSVYSKELIMTDLAVFQEAMRRMKIRVDTEKVPVGYLNLEDLSDDKIAQIFENNEEAIKVYKKDEFYFPSFYFRQDGQFDHMSCH